MRIHTLIPSLGMCLLFSSCTGGDRAGATRFDLDHAERELTSGRMTAAELLVDARYAAIRTEPEFKRLLRDRLTESRLRIVPDRTPGEALRVEGRVVDTEGNGVADAMVFVHQTDARGYYGRDRSDDEENAWIFGLVVTDAEGRFTIDTIRPASYAHAPDTPAHIHFGVRADGYERASGVGPPSLYFADDPKLVGEALAELEADGATRGVPRRDANGVWQVEYEYRVRRRMP